MKKVLAIAIIILVAFAAAQSQTPELDSLKREIPQKSGTQKLESYRTLIRQIINHNYDSAIVYLDKGLKYARKIDNLDYEIKFLSYSASAYSWSARYEKALESIREMEALAIKHNYNDRLISSWAQMGSIFRNIEQYDSSLYYFLKAKKKIRQLGCDVKPGEVFQVQNDSIKLIYVRTMVAFIDFGLLYYDLGKLDKSLNMFQKSLTIAKNIGDNNRIIASLANIGMVYNQYSKKVEDGKVKTSDSVWASSEVKTLRSKALDKYLEALRISEETNYRFYWGNISNNIASLYSEMDETENAIKYYKIALKEYKRIGDKKGVMTTYNNLGLLNINMGNYLEAIDELEKAIEIGVNTGSHRYVAYYSLLSAYAYDSLGNYRKAYEKALDYKRYNDSALNAEELKQIEELEIKYETEIKENAIERLQKENELKSNIFIMSAALGVSLIALVIILWRQNNYKKRVNDRLRELNAAKDRLFSILGHDLRAPFNALANLSEAVSEHYEEYGSEKIKNYVAQINRSSTELLKLVDSLLQWAKAQTGDAAPKPEDVNAKEAVYDTFALHREQAAVKNVYLEEDLPKDLTVRVDRNMLDSILRNLVSNAVKFSDPGMTARVEAKRSGEFAEIAVIDEGAGMSEECLANVFNIEKKKVSNGTNGEKGAGLGLVICKEFVEKSGGRIWAESPPGKGSAFYFTLPLAKTGKVFDESFVEEKSKLIKEAQNEFLDKENLSEKSLDELIAAMEGDLSEKWRLASRDNMIENIEDFSKALAAQADKREAVNFKRYAEKFAAATESFDVETIAAELGKFPKLMEEYKRIRENEYRR